MNACGVVTNADITLPDIGGDAFYMLGFFNALGAALEAPSIPLPTEDVGPGASWNELRSQVSGWFALKEAIEYQATMVNSSKATLQAKHSRSMQGEPEPVQDDVNPLSITVQTYQGASQGSLEIDFGRLTPEMRMSFEDRASFDLSMQGYSGSGEIVIHADMRIYREDSIEQGSCPGASRIRCQEDLGTEQPIVYPGSTVFGMNNNPGYPKCYTGFDESGPESAYIFQPRHNGSATMCVHSPGVDLDIFALLDDCQAIDNCRAGADSCIDFSFEADETWYIVVDGYRGVSSPFELTVDCR